jgi:hypothetical protein
MSSQGSVEEIFSLQASLDLTPDCGPPSPSPALGKDLIPASTYEQLKVHLCHREGEFSLYSAHLVCEFC